MEPTKDQENLWEWADKAALEYKAVRARLTQKHGTWEKAQKHMPHNLKVAHQLKRIFPTSAQ